MNSIETIRQQVTKLMQLEPVTLSEFAIVAYVLNDKVGSEDLYAMLFFVEAFDTQIEADLRAQEVSQATGFKVLVMQRGKPAPLAAAYDARHQVEVKRAPPTLVTRRAALEQRLKETEERLGKVSTYANELTKRGIELRAQLLAIDQEEFHHGTPKGHPDMNLIDL